MKVYLLSGGLLEVDRAVIHPGDDSHRKVTLPIMQYLIQNDGQSILVDTGNPVAAAGDPHGLEREYGTDPAWIKPLATADERIDRQLQKLGLQISDLDMVINTHFHFDHAGANALFAGSIPITAQEAELMTAPGNDDYLPVWDAPGLEFRSVKGDWGPIPGVEMLLTPGHTPGHQSMLVRLKPRPWLFTVDAVYTEEHWRENKVGAVVDVSAARSSVDRLRHVCEQEHAHLIFGHDIGQWRSLGMGESDAPKLVASDE